MAVALVQVGRLSMFMLDASWTAYSLFPSSEWETRRSRVSAYYVAGQLAGKGRIAIATLLGWMATCVYVPVDWLPPRPLAVVGLIPHTVTIAVLV